MPTYHRGAEFEHLITPLVNEVRWSIHDHLKDYWGSHPAEARRVIGTPKDSAELVAIALGRATSHLATSIGNQNAENSDEYASMFVANATAQAIACPKSADLRTSAVSYLRKLLDEYESLEARP